MDDFANRTINELIESYPLLVDVLKDLYDDILKIFNNILSNGFMNTEQLRMNGSSIECEAFDCFFEDQIYKLMEKYTYHEKIHTQLSIIEHINQRQKFVDLKLKSSIDRNSKIPGKYRQIALYYNTHCNRITFYIDSTHYHIKIKYKYKQDMLNLF